MRFVLMLLMSIWFGGGAAAQSDADRSAVRGTIEGQIQAFLADDGPRAYSYAAPGIRQMFPTSAIFMEMVRRGYAPVYRPRSYAFGELRQLDRGLEQIVEIVDSGEELWTARYTLELVDGAWRITGCQLEKKPGRVA